MEGLQIPPYSAAYASIDPQGIGGAIFGQAALTDDVASAFTVPGIEGFASQLLGNLRSPADAHGAL